MSWVKCWNNLQSYQIYVCPSSSFCVSHNYGSHNIISHQFALRVFLNLILLSNNGRLGNDGSSAQTGGLFVCAVCQADLAPNEGISVHAGSIFSMSSKPWQGPFLCADCRNKKDAMEGKRPSGVKVV